MKFNLVSTLVILALVSDISALQHHKAMTTNKVAKPVVKKATVPAKVVPKVAKVVAV